jgi:predicted metal-binding membrane protein
MAAASAGRARGERAPAAAVAVTLAIAAACWVVAVREMRGMDMGVATTLGSLAFFLGMWAPMMAAMMLPGAAPAVLRRARAGRGVPLFLAAYLAVWTLAGLAVYALYSPHGTTVAGAIVIAAGAYELTPLKRTFRRRCREREGLGFGLDCVGSSAGLMAMLVALGAMSIAWMTAVAAAVIAQKLLPARAAVDVPLALAIAALGILIVASPASVPGLAPAMM